MERVFSSIMLVADDITNELDYEEDNVNFSTSKALILDDDNLMLYERNGINFIEFDKPKLCETENLAVYGIFKSTIILSPVDSSVDPEVCYFLSYNERMQPTFFKRIDFTVSIHNERDILGLWSKNYPTCW